MNVQDFYDDLAADYHLIFNDWRQAVQHHGNVLNQFIKVNYTSGTPRTILDCSCGIGTQAIGLALQGYTVHGTDLSPAAVQRAIKEAESFGVEMTFGVADFRHLDTQVEGTYDIVLSGDNSLPHLLDDADLLKAAHSIYSKLKPGGLFIASIRDYDKLLEEKPQTTPISTWQGRISFQLWDWHAEKPEYTIKHFILLEKSPGQWETHFRQTTYRALRRHELTEILRHAGFTSVRWYMPQESLYYQPLVTAYKDV